MARDARPQSGVGVFTELRGWYASAAKTLKQAQHAKILEHALLEALPCSVRACYARAKH